jgi:hypothetical protein
VYPYRDFPPCQSHSTSAMCEADQSGLMYHIYIWTPSLWATRCKAELSDSCSVCDAMGRRCCSVACKIPLDTYVFNGMFPLDTCVNNNTDLYINMVVQLSSHLYNRSAHICSLSRIRFLGTMPHTIQVSQRAASRQAIVFVQGQGGACTLSLRTRAVAVLPKGDLFTLPARYIAS